MNRPLSEGNRLQRAYARWAAPRYTCMSPEVREQAELIDRFLYSRRGLKFWAALWVALGASTVGLRYGGMSWISACLVAGVLWVVLPLALLSAWLQPQPFTWPKLRRKLPAIFAMAVLGTLAGFITGGTLRTGSFEWSQLLSDLQRASRVLVPAALAAALSVLAVAMGVAAVRRHLLERALQREREARELERLAHERDAAARQAAEAQLKLLQGQIQPHFIFNTLSAVQHWVDTGDARGAPLLRALTAFLRGSTELLGRDRATLAQELEMVDHYLATMRARMGGRLTSTIELPAALAAVPVPPGIVLTLVENALEHGIQPKLEGGEVRVRAFEETGRLVIEVLDTGLGPAADLTEGIGLANTRARLARAFGPSAQLCLAALPAGGCMARLEWPWPVPSPTDVEGGA